MKNLSQLFLLLSVLFIQNVFSQTTVYVKTDQKGRGILKNRGSECFVITPEHLVKNYNGYITIFGEGSIKSTANLLRSYVGDLAILRFEGENNQNCTTWQLTKNYSVIIENISEGYVEVRGIDGSTEKFTVSINTIDEQYITILPKHERDKFRKGMSGSSLFVEYQGEKVFLGMLQSISDDENGSVIRADEMDKLLSAFFNPVKKSSLCSDIYIYRKNGFLECPETVYLYNHGELLVKLQPGTRYLAKVCDDRSFKFSVKTNPNDIAYSTSKPDIKLGKIYYFKVSCGVGVSTVALQENKKGEKEINSNGKFKRKLKPITLTEY